MDSRLTGSNEIIYIQTDKVSISIKGQASHPYMQGVVVKEKQATLKLLCHGEYDEIALTGENEVKTSFAKGGYIYREYETIPMFYEQQRYEIVIESIYGSEVEFWHDNYHIRNKVTSVGRSAKILSGVINFGNEIGLSDLIVRVNGKEHLRIIIEVYPSKISYKDDYLAIMSDVTNEIYNLIFDVLKKTYQNYAQNDKIGNSLVEFFAVIRKIYGSLIKAVDIILRAPHHELKADYQVLPSHKIKDFNGRCLRWIEKHPQHVEKADSNICIDRSLCVKKQITYNTKENQFTKYILYTVARRLNSFKKNYMCLQRDVDWAVLKEIDGMIYGINRRINHGCLAEIKPHEFVGMSLVFSMGVGYRELYKYYLMLMRGLSITGDVFTISIKDLAVLYEYWCFIKLNSIMRNNQSYVQISQDIVRVHGNGLFVSLVKGRTSKVKYRYIKTGELITLTYNPKEISSPTVTQKPDNVLSLEKKGAGTVYEYVFDAKYRINSALPGTDYYTTISHTPGPEVGDINTMHRYRDAIVYERGIDQYQRSMFGAYVLFPYSNEQEYSGHRFFKSIDEVNIGGLPFLPSATKLVSNLLDQLVADSPDSAFERAVLPRGIESKLAKVDWNNKDVMVGALSNKEQLQICLDNKFYHIPCARLRESDFPIHYIAIYQSKKLFGLDCGIKYYGIVTKCIPVHRYEIKEIPSSKSDMYYRFEIKEWVPLTRFIRAKEIARTILFTNIFLLKHSQDMPELLIQSESEYRLYMELKRAANDTAINDDDSDLSFKCGDNLISFSDGNIYISSGKNIVGKYSIGTFINRPNSVLSDIRRLLQ